MYKLIRIIFTICIFLNPEVILPQTIKVLTLTEAINLATENNNELVTARLEQVKAEEKVSEVYRDNLAPNFVLSSRYSRNFKKPTFNIFGETFEIGADNELVNTLEIQYSIPVLGVPVFQGIRVAEYYQQLSETNVKNIKNSVIAQVKKVVFMLHFSQRKLLRLINNRLKIQRTIYRLLNQDTKTALQQNLIT